MFERLLASAPEVILSVAGDRARCAAAAESAARGDRRESTRPRSGASRAWRWPAARAVRRSSRSPMRRMPPVTAGEGARGGARLLELQAACPFRAQAELRLGARALDEPAVGRRCRGPRRTSSMRRSRTCGASCGDQATLRALDEPVRAGPPCGRAVAAALAKARDSADELLQAPARDRGRLARGARARHGRRSISGARPSSSRRSSSRARRASVRSRLELRPDRVDRLAGRLAGGDRLQDRRRAPR